MPQSQNGSPRPAVARTVLHTQLVLFGFVAGLQVGSGVGVGVGVGDGVGVGLGEGVGGGVGAPSVHTRILNRGQYTSRPSHQ